jgi:Tol biopolymer transport system component
VGTGSFVNLTQGNEQFIVSTIRIVGFSGDGSEIWLHDGDAKNALRLVPLMGGPSRTFLGKGPLKMPPISAAWASDGARVVFHTGDPGDPMLVGDRTGANARQIFVDPNPGMHNHWPAWSQDGRWIYFSRGSHAAEEFDLWRIGSAGGEPERLTYHNSFVAYATPISQRTVLYVARDPDGSGPWLWSVDVERKVTRRVSFGLEQYTSIAASADGRRAVATVSNPTASLWSVPILDRRAEEPDAQPFALPTVRALAPRFGGDSLFYLSSRGTGDGLWRYQAGKSREIWRGADGRLLEPPAISLDGQRVAFALRHNGKLRLHQLTADGADFQAVADTLEVQGAAGWSPDAKWIVTGGSDARGAGLFKIPVEGGAPVRLATGPARDPVWSPDGSVIVYAGASQGPYAPLRATRPDGAAVELPAIDMLVGGARARFLPGSERLVYMQGSVSAQDFWILDLETMKTRQLAHLTNSATIRTFDITPDGKQIVFDRLRENSDIVLVDLPK